MGTLSADEAAGLLRLNVKRVQALARQGKLPAARVGRKWLFQSDDIERLIGARSAGSREGRGPVEISARNYLRGEIVAITRDGLMAEVELAIGDQRLVSVITRSSADRLGLTIGRPVFAIVKATEVMIGTEE